jgi:hypothetical protein
LPGKRAPASVRFWRHVRIDKDGCWEWTGSLNRDGYGQLKVAGKPVKASRLSWELHFGPIPPGLFVCHHCDNPRCVRPDHLFLGTALHNNRDAIRKGRRPDLVPNLVAAVRRLSDEDIAAVRQRSTTGESGRSIARSLGCHHTTINRLLNGTHWGD